MRGLLANEYKNAFGCLFASPDYRLRPLFVRRCFFSTLDRSWSFWHVPAPVRNNDRTALATQHGTYRYTRLHLGLKNAPATFQRALHIIPSSFQRQICNICLDEVTIILKTVAKRVLHLDTVPALRRNAGILLKLKDASCFSPKSVISVTSLDQAASRSPKRSRKRFRTFDFPETLARLRSLLGACNV